MKDRLDYELSPSADNDLLEIYNYTWLNYGEMQADAYFAELEKAFSVICDNPRSGRSQATLRTGLRSFPKGRHLVFYRVLSDRIRIVRILSMTQDVKRVLGAE